MCVKMSILKISDQYLMNIKMLDVCVWLNMKIDMKKKSTVARNAGSSLDGQGVQEESR